LTKRNSAYLFLTGIIPLAVASCTQEPPAMPPPMAPPQIRFTKSGLIEAAVRDLQLPGIPDAPLSSSSTRQQRDEYLLATESALRALKDLPGADAGKPHLEKTLLPASRSDEVLAIGNLLAVELGAAIDRSDQMRAAAALRLAWAYANTVGEECIENWVVSDAIAESMCRGIKAVAGQLDDKSSALLRSTLSELQTKFPSPDTAIRGTLSRLKAWQIEQSNLPPATPEQVLHEVAGQERIASNPALLAALRSRAAGDGMLTAAIRTNESRITEKAVSDYLEEVAAGGRPVPISIDSGTHPLAALYLAALRPSLDAAPGLTALRKEGVQLVGLTIRIIAAELPKDLSGFGEDATSPMSNLKFEYHRSATEFELVRPRKTR
jgi:hypothetical protein